MKGKEIEPMDRNTIHVTADPFTTLAETARRMELAAGPLADRFQALERARIGAELATADSFAILARRAMRPSFEETVETARRACDVLFDAPARSLSDACERANRWRHLDSLEQLSPYVPGAGLFGPKEGRS
jgi:hypothetical protein